MANDTDSDHFVEKADDEQTLWEVIEIVAEKAKHYRVRWAGRNPKTGRPWPLDWVPKRDCTTILVNAWKEKQAAKKPTKGKAAAGGKAGAKTRAADAPPARGKGKAKAKEVIPSDSESDKPDETRSTRASSSDQPTTRGRAIAGE